MADPEQVKILFQGSEVWNRWRKQQPEDLQIDLSGIDLHEARRRQADRDFAHHAILQGAKAKSLKQSNGLLNRWSKQARNLPLDLHGIDLHGANLRQADLSFANLRGANLAEADLTEANLTRADLFKVNLYLANLCQADLRVADLSQAFLWEAELSDAFLLETKLNNADLSFAGLCRSRLPYADLSYADLSHADLSYTDLRRAKLHGSDVSMANLHKADLKSADLYRASLYYTDLSEADLSQASLIFTRLRKTYVRGTNLSQAIFDETILADIDLREAKGLLEIIYQGPSNVSLYSVQLPQDGSALHFLRGCGVSDEWIDDYRARMMYPIQYHSCFISYSSKDEVLARRLHADLQDRGVRCWFAPHDMKIGDRIRSSLDQAIHQHEKLLLLLSEHSINSTWVEDEMETALERERREHRSMLFPIRLDDAVIKTSQAWAARLRRQINIGDFTNWTDPQAYQQAFERLLRDLKKAGT